MTGQAAICSPLELKERRNANADFILLDVRTADEAEVACLADCVHIPLHELESRVDELRPWQNREIVVMCHHGGRSARAQQFLLGRGFARVTNLAGGIDLYAVQVDPSLPRY